MNKHGMFSAIRMHRNPIRIQLNPSWSTKYSKKEISEKVEINYHQGKRDAFGNKTRNSLKNKQIVNTKFPFECFNYIPYQESSFCRDCKLRQWLWFQWEQQMRRHKRLRLGSPITMD